MSEIASHMPLGDLFESLDKEGFLFRTQGIEGNEYVPAEEIMADFKHGDMAEMLQWPAVWNGDTLTVTVLAPEDAIESPKAQIDFPAQRASRSTMESHS